MTGYAPLPPERRCRSWFQWEDYAGEKHRVRCDQPRGHLQDEDSPHRGWSEGEEVAW